MHVIELITLKNNNMSFLKNNSSQFNTNGDSEKLLGLTRKIRPYRHAIIRIIKPNGGSLSYEYINGVNEFGPNLITSTGDGPGLYDIFINAGLFHNIENVVQEIDVIHCDLTSIGEVPIVTSTFDGSDKTRISINIFQFSTFNTIDIEGELSLTIMEYYD